MINKFGIYKSCFSKTLYFEIYHLLIRIKLKIIFEIGIDQIKRGKTDEETKSDKNPTFQD
ncbi:MAG: hypothetical protein BAJALOKI1v1_1150012 [Promethearchaeota archaeon]|nr:MAG: hypothetical protein BAJALOKI1v1_1150012 [Candidatus Lokiarchaeota archaeon]